MNVAIHKGQGLDVNLVGVNRLDFHLKASYSLIELLLYMFMYPTVLKVLGYRPLQTQNPICTPLHCGRHDGYLRQRLLSIR